MTRQEEREREKLKRSAKDASLSLSLSLIGVLPATGAGKRFLVFHSTHNCIFNSNVTLNKQSTSEKVIGKMT